MMIIFRCYYVYYAQTILRRFQNIRPVFTQKCRAVGRGLSSNFQDSSTVNLFSVCVDSLLTTFFTQHLQLPRFLYARTLSLSLSLSLSVSLCVCVSPL